MSASKEKKKKDWRRYRRNHMDDFVDASQRYRDWRKKELNYYRNEYNDEWRKKHPNRDEPEFRKRNFERTNTTHKYLKRTKPLNPDNFSENAIYDIYRNSGYRMDWNDFIDKFKRDELKLYMNTKEF